MQRNHRIDSRGASRRKVAGDRGDQHHHPYRQKHRHGISRGEAEEKSGDESTHSDRDTQTGGDTDHDENHGFAHDQAHNVLTLRAEGHADSDLVRSPCDVVGHQSEQPDGRK